MATAIVSAPKINDTDANFRLWGKGFSDALLACGLTKASDTGQIDWTTVTRPLTNVSQGYEIWRFSDALQASAPVFIKIEYGGAATAANPNIWFTVGTGTNGSGTLTGQVGTRSSMGTANNETAVGNIYVSCASNRMSFIFWPEFSNKSFMASVERVRDSAGAETTDIYVVNAQNNNALQQQVIPTTGAIVARADCAVPKPSGSTMIYGALVGTLPFFPQKGALLPPSVCLVGYMSADLTTVVAVTVTIFGVSRTYLPVGGTPIMTVTANGSTTFMMRWE
jgi:hypothetical protein